MFQRPDMLQKKNWTNLAWRRSTQAKCRIPRESTFREHVSRIAYACKCRHTFSFLVSDGHVSECDVSQICFHQHDSFLACPKRQNRNVLRALTLLTIITKLIAFLVLGITSLSFYSVDSYLHVLVGVTSTCHSADWYLVLRVSRNSLHQCAADQFAFGHTRCSWIGKQT